LFAKVIFDILICKTLFSLVGNLLKGVKKTKSCKPNLRWFTVTTEGVCSNKSQVYFHYEAIIQNRITVLQVKHIFKENYIIMLRYAEE